MVSQREELDNLYKQYAADPRFNDLRKTGINLVTGKGPLNPKIMLIGEAPGHLENANRMPFVGKSGSNLTHLLTDNGLDPYDIFMTNVVKYWPKPPKPGIKRFFNHREIVASREYIQKEIEIVRPKIVGLCGKFAIQAIFPEKTQIFADHATLLEGKFVPLYHPIVLSYDKEKKALLQKGYAKLKDYIA